MKTLRERVEDAICNGLDQERAWALREDYEGMRAKIASLDLNEFLDHLETAMEHEHKFQFQGTVAWDGIYPLPGTGARERHYAERYYCTGCLEFKHTDVRTNGNTYQPLKFNAILLDKDPTK